MPSTLASHLDARTAEGKLYDCLPDNAVRCVACGHRCFIREGRRGICKVRFNEGGRLMVPRNYVAALQCDPVEKKPFFHVLPGTNALTFGMLGCDFHCGYCFPGDTVVLTDRGPAIFADLFGSCLRFEQRGDAEIAYPTDVRAIAASGQPRRIRGVVRHPYRSSLVVLRPYDLPPLRCTPDHRVYATDSPDAAPRLVVARDLTTRDYLAIPRRYVASGETVIDVLEQLRDHVVTYRVRGDLGEEDPGLIASVSARGEASRAIGVALGKSRSSIRYAGSKLARGLGTSIRSSGPILGDDGRVLFPGEPRPGLRRRLPADADLAALLGYYCAEGCVVRSRKRPNSYVLNFDFSLAEGELAGRVRALLSRCLGLNARLVRRETTIRLAVGKASAALLFKSLAGGRSSEKRVPAILARAPTEIIRVFLDAYVEGDGHRHPNGKVTATTLSPQLAYGIAWLALRAGYMPSVYKELFEARDEIQGRELNLSPARYAVAWHTNPALIRKVFETSDHHLVPLRGVEVEEFDGLVYNMEVGEEHNYLAGFFLVSNCQNWVTSQSLRDERATTDALDVTAEELVALAERHDGRLVVSSYNEPLITSEWAVEVFQVARREGLVTGFVSNGNATPEALDFVRPHADIYKIDLKTMSDRNYRKLGGVLQNVLDSIRLVHERGFWLEVVTLVVPGFSDDEGQLRAAAEYIASIDRSIPWHITAFHEDYKMRGMGDTTAKTLVRACEIGAEAGLNFVYAGNLPGRVGPWENTFCPSCRTAVIERLGYHILANRMGHEGTCPECGARIPGLFTNPRGASRPSRGHGCILPVGLDQGSCG